MMKECFKALDDRFAKICSSFVRPTIPIGRLLKGLLFGILFSIAVYGFFTPRLTILRRSTVTERQTGGYHCFRIPVIEVAPNGDLLVFCEARKNSESDYGYIDLVMFRSKDGGRSWGERTIVATNGGDTTSEPAVISDKKLGRLHLLYQKRPGGNTFQDYLGGTANDARGYHTYSVDSGYTWSPPVDITSQILPETNKVLPMFGPNRGIVLQSGRLLAPMYYADRATGNFQAAPIYSDDGGMTWQRSNDWGPPGATETTLIQAGNGDVLAIARNDTVSDNRKVYAVSLDAGSTWVKQGETNPYILEGSCQQSMTTMGGIIYFSQPVHQGGGFMERRQDGRVKVGLYDRSVAGNVKWQRQKELQVTAGGFAYSSIANSNNSLHLAYELVNPEGGRDDRTIAIEYVEMMIR